ncbi:acyl-CoA carboxylase epsilon subunit [Kitasatospora sp. NPDC047058]|uniref:acyl-CoA carboxylase epsilon subunit n=1 Tax=Kitasatospora sp. NPDC047058 TaxID=3155620 RepID=UPI0033F30922
MTMAARVAGPGRIRQDVHHGPAATGAPHAGGGPVSRERVEAFPDGGGPPARERVEPLPGEGDPPAREGAGSAPGTLAPALAGPLAPTLFRVIAGNPGPEELAAIAALLSVRAAAARPAPAPASAPTSAPPARWERSARRPAASWASPP